MNPCKKCGGTERYKDGRCKQCCRANSRAWCAANPEKNRARVRAWQAANPEKELARVRTWRAANLKKTRASTRASMRMGRVNLTDSYICHLFHDNGIKAVIPQPLIEAKRAHLQLLRLVRSIERNQQTQEQQS